jgi:hypothetical protein
MQQGRVAASSIVSRAAGVRMRNYDRLNLIVIHTRSLAPTGQKWERRCAGSIHRRFSIPDGTFGNFGVGVLRDQTFHNVDFSLIKNFRFHESKNIHIRAEAFNVFNFQIRGTPSATIGSGTPGVISSIASTPRDLPFGAKFSY